MALKAKEFRYAVDLGEGDTVRTEDGTPLGPGPEWTPEHLLLAGILRCSLKSLRHHAARGGIDVRHATGSARGLVTRRESDDRYAVVETDIDLALDLEPQPGAEELAALTAKAERDCFVGASLTAKPTYRWTLI